MKFHKTCKTLPIYNFNEILKANDLRFLVKDYDEYEDEEFKLVGEETAEATAIFKSIIYEYSELTFNREILLNYNSQIKIVKEEFKYSITEKILNNYNEFENEIVLTVLPNIGWNFDIDGDIEMQLVSIIGSMKKLKTKISILKLKYEEKFKNKNKKQEDAELYDKLDEETISLELSLKLSYSIDTKKTSVSKWISMWNISNKLNKPKIN